MATNREYSPLWWDRDVDDDGVPIREDVRQAAQDIWPTCCSHVKTMLGDTADAPELMEAAVAHVSRYLTRYRAKPFYPQAKSLLNLHFTQELRRFAGRQGRVQAVGHIAELDALAPPSWDWARSCDFWLDIGKLHSQVTDRGWIMFAMRHLGHGWPEVSEKLGIAVSTALNYFRNDFKETWARLHGGGKSVKPNGKRD